MRENRYIDHAKNFIISPSLKSVKFCLALNVAGNAEQAREIFVLKFQAISKQETH